MTTEAVVRQDPAVVVVDRVRWSRGLRYRGFDGFLEDAPGDISAWDRLREERGQPEVDVVLVARPDAVPGLLATGWSLLGFDAGYLVTETAHFSLLLNAVICGPLEALRAFEPLLNTVQLAPDVSTALAISDAYRRAAAAGLDVEDCPSLDVFAILER